MHMYLTPYTATSIIYSIYFFYIVCVYNSVFFGSRPVYVLADVDLFKEVTVKHFDKFVDRLVRACPYSTLPVFLCVSVFSFIMGMNHDTVANLWHY